MEIIEARNMLAAQVRDKALPAPVLIYRPSFSAGETVGPLSFDLAWPEHKVGVIIRDAREHRDERAARYVVETHGWRVCLCSTHMVERGAAILAAANALTAAGRPETA
jgi:hypothetical protein